MDDLKISHKDANVVTRVIKDFEKVFGKEAPLSVTRGKIHDYLGMKIDFSTPGSVIFSMDQYVRLLLEEAPEELFERKANTPAGSHLLLHGVFQFLNGVCR